MKIISHRANLNGPNQELENSPVQINKVIDLGYDVEIDLWFKDGNFYLGHDFPYYKIDKYWLLNRKQFLWIHIKNIDVMETDTIKNLNYFWHESDKFTLTSNGTPWCFPGIYIQNGITVCLERHVKIQSNILGICTDYVEDYK